jgi:hypothetical protein
MKRLYFPLVALFWVAMNVLLWRTELAGGKDAGSPIPVQVVWERILSAPDASQLDIFRGQAKIGHCRWVPNVGEEVRPGGPLLADQELEGRIRRATGYSLDLEGTARLADGAPSLRFGWRAEFSAQHDWTSMFLRLIARPNLVELKADAAAEKVKVRFGSPETPWERDFTFAELKQPERVLAAIGAPFAGGLLTWLPAVSAPLPAQPLELGVEWRAYSDWLKIGSARTRIYRLQARLFDKHQIVVIVSRVGEILRVELPGDFRIVNDAFTTL